MARLGRLEVTESGDLEPEQHFSQPMYPGHVSVVHGIWIRFLSMKNPFASSLVFTHCTRSAGGKA